jgi:pyruvate dehydrogenase E1 component
VAATDYVRAVPESVRAFLPEGRKYLTLGTDGFGRSADRESLRRHFEVDAPHIVVAALYALAEEGEIDRGIVQQAIQDLGVDPNAADAARA